MSGIRDEDKKHSHHVGDGDNVVQYARDRGISPTSTKPVFAAHQWVAFSTTLTMPGALPSSRKLMGEPTCS